MRFLSICMLGATILASPGFAAASVLVVDRGLPTDNLNNAAGASRSNVAWADGPVPYFYGDTFTLPTGAGGTVYSFDTIRTWVVSSAADLATTFPSVTLFTGSDTSLTATAASVSITPVTYTGGASYETRTGSFINLYEVDFTGLNIVAAAGTTMSFGVEGTGTGANWFNHASNAALSGSPQDGADDLLSEYSWDGVSAPVFLGSVSSNAASFWDKASDINVQVLATVPEPGSLTLLAAGVAGFAAVRRRRRPAIPA